MTRDPLDRYYTPDALALGCIRWLDRTMGQPSRVLEPCSGGGPFGRAALAEWPGVAVTGCDPDPEAFPGYLCDRVPLADWRPAVARGITAIVTNPHYVGVYETVATLRDLQRRALHFHLDTRRPEVIRSERSGAPGRRPSLADTLRESLRSRVLTADIDRERLIELGMQYLADAESASALQGASAPMDDS